MKKDHSQCVWGSCVHAICQASDSGMATQKCWCPECKEIREELKACAEAFNQAQITQFFKNIDAALEAEARKEGN